MAVAITRNPFANDFDIVSQTPPDKISDLMQNILQGEQAKMHARDRMRKRAMDLSLLIKANQSSIGSQLLPTPTGKMPVISSSYAEISCASLGSHGLLNRLNSLLGTSYTPPLPSLFSLLESCVSAEYDFGTAYGLLRPRWYAESYSTTIQDELYNLKREDQKIRQQVLVSNRIRTVMPPRRVWDLHSNRVVPYCFTLEEPWAISYARKLPGDCVDSDVMIDINGREWPVTMPKSADLDTIREELLKMGAEYVWLDILCLRQKNGQREDLRVEEWKTDVPTIGNVYRWAEVVVYYFGGFVSALGSKTDNFDGGGRCWFNRAWPLQEDTNQRIPAAPSDDNPPHAERIDSKSRGTGILTTFHKQLKSMSSASGLRGGNIFDVLADMRKRVSTNPVDRVAGLACLLWLEAIPVYHESESLEDAWMALVDEMLPLMRSSFLFLYPEGGLGPRKWRPTWKQVMTMPLPADVVLLGNVDHNNETGEDSYEGLCIEMGLIRGLDLGSAEVGDRRGELVVEDMAGISHTFQIHLTHEYPIPEDTYTLLGSRSWSAYRSIRSLQYWVIGRRLPGQKFEKVSVFQMTDSEEVERLKELGITVECHNILV